MDTDSFVIHIKTEDFYKDIADDVERWFDTSNYDEKDERPLPTGKNKKVIGLFKDELGGKVMIEFCALRAKAYAYRLDDDTEKKKAKGTKKCIVKREITFKNYMDSLFNDEVTIKLQQRFRSDHHRVYTEEVNKIALRSHDDKRLQTFDKVTAFPYGTNVFKVCESEMLSKNKLSELDEDKNKPKDKDKDNDKNKDNDKDKDKARTKDENKDKTRAIDRDKTTPKTKIKTEDKDKTTPKTTTTPKTKTKTEDKDKTTPKTRAEIEDKDKTTPETKTKIEDKDKSKIEDKDEDIDKGRDKFIQVFQYAKQKRGEKGNWVRRQIVWVFWDDAHVSELCKKWMRHNHEYAYTQFEKLRTYSGEVLFTREHNTTTSKDKPNT